MCCPVVFHEEIIAIFWMKMCQIDTENDKTQNFLFFKDFTHFLLKFRQTSWIVMFERVIKEKVGCPVAVYEEIIAMVWAKMSQIDTKNDKNLKISNSLGLHAFFPQIFDKIYGLEH